MIMNSIPLFSLACKSLLRVMAAISFTLTSAFGACVCCMCFPHPQHQAFCPRAGFNIPLKNIMKVFDHLRQKEISSTLGHSFYHFSFFFLCILLMMRARSYIFERSAFLMHFSFSAFCKQGELN